MAKSNDPERRWVNYNGQWRLFRLAPSDPRYDGSEPYNEGERAPGEMDPAYERAQAEQAATKSRRSAANKARTADTADNK